MERRTVNQIKVGCTSFAATYILSFDTASAFVHQASNDGFYARVEEKERKKMLAEIYKLAKKQFGPPEKKESKKDGNDG